MPLMSMQTLSIVPIVIIGSTMRASRGPSMRSTMRASRGPPMRSAGRSPMRSAGGPTMGIPWGHVIVVGWVSKLLGGRRLLLGIVPILPAV